MMRIQQIISDLDHQRESKQIETRQDQNHRNAEDQIGTPYHQPDQDHHMEKRENKQNPTVNTIRREITTLQNATHLEN
jgi:hypothetical protein